jgi:predicted transcriptional regulator
MLRAAKLQRTTLILDPEVHKRLRVLAIERSVTFTALVTEALEQYLARAKAKKGDASDE